MELWNTKMLPSPPINTCKSKIKEVDFRILTTSIHEGIDFFTNQQLLYKEAAVLSRIIYRMKMKFRSAKDMKSMEKIKKCLLSYLEMDLISTLQIFRNLMPSQYQDKKLYLPTKNLLDYILVRLQGLGKLLARILETCKISATLVHKRIILGHMWNYAIMLVGVISRIYILIKEMLKFVSNFYCTLKPFSSVLKNTGIAWLPHDYTLPNDLIEWLEVDWLEIDNNIIEIPDDDDDDNDGGNINEPLIRFFDLAEDSDDSIIEV